MADAGILGIIVSKLRHGKKPCLIILLKVDEGLEVGFYRTILPLNLVVCLRMKGDKKSPLDVEEIA